MDRIRERKKQRSKERKGEKEIHDTKNGHVEKKRSK
jgi:hypothetical protein